MKIENKMYAACEIAKLLGVTLPSVRGAIKRLLKTRNLVVDCAGGEVVGNRIIPTHFGLDVVIALAFQFDTHEAKQFQKEVIARLNATQPIFTTIPKSDMIFS